VSIECSLSETNQQLEIGQRTWHSLACILDNLSFLEHQVFVVDVNEFSILRGGWVSGEALPW